MKIMNLETLFIHLLIAAVFYQVGRAKGTSEMSTLIENFYKNKDDKNE